MGLLSSPVPKVLWMGISQAWRYPMDKSTIKKPLLQMKSMPKGDTKMKEGAKVRENMKIATKIACE